MRRVAAAFLGIGLSVCAGLARAEPIAEGLTEAVAELESGKQEEAIATLEALADRGFAHPDVAFTRGLAYAQRARGKGAVPGDLGRAAAGFEEALLLRPDDEEARASLAIVRGEVARRRSHRGKDEVSVGNPPDRLLVELATERVWAALAACSSLTLALGLLLRRRPAGPAHVAGVLAVPLGILGVLLFVPATWWAGVLARERGVAVVVAQELTLVDRAGVRVDAPVVPEAARLEVGPAEDGRVPIRWGSYEGWAPIGAVRRLAR